MVMLGLYLVLISIMLITTASIGFNIVAFTPNEMYNSIKCNIFEAWLLVLLHFIINPLGYLCKFVYFITHYKSHNKCSGQDFDGDYCIKK